MTNVKEFPSDRPELKIADLQGKAISIASVSKKETTYQGKDITFYNAVLSNGKTVSINQIIYEMVQRDREPPTIGTVTQVKSGNGRKYWTLK